MRDRVSFWLTVLFLSGLLAILACPGGISTALEASTSDTGYAAPSARRSLEHSTGQAPSQDETELELAIAGQVGGPTFALGASADHAYMGSGRTLLAIDLCDPSQPKVTGVLGLPEKPVHMDVVADTAYIALGEPGLAVVDLAEPDSPRLLSIVEVGLGAGRIAVSGNWGYVADIENQLHRVDLSDLENPQIDTVVELPVYADDLAIAGDAGELLVVTCSIRGKGAAKRVLVFDLGAPDWTNPRGSLDLNSTASEAMYVATSGDKAYVACGSRLHTVDLIGPSSPEELARVGLPGGDEPIDPYPGVSSEVGILGDYVYMAGTIGAFYSVGRVWVFDVSDPANPEYLRRTETIEEDLPAPPRLWVNEDAVVTAAYSYLAVLDVSTPDKPAVAGSCEGFRDANGVVVRHENHLYAGMVRSVRVFDLSNPRLPVEVAALHLPTAIESSRVGAIRFVDDTAYVGLAGPVESELYAVDVSVPEVPAIIGTSEVLSGSVYHVTVLGDHAYLSMGVEKPDVLSTLRVLDISNPAGMREVTEIEGGGAFELNSGTGVMAFGDELRTVDLSNPASPQRIGGLLIPDLDVHLLVADGYAYIRSRARTKMPLHVVDVSDPSSLHEMGGLDDESIPRAMKEHYFLTGGCLRGVRVVDISNPAAPFLAAHSKWPSCLYGIDYKDNYLYVGGWLDALAVLELKAPIEPTPEPTDTATATPHTAPTPTAGTAAPRLDWSLYLPVCDSQDQSQ